MTIDIDPVEAVVRDDLVDRLRVHDTHYIGGGSAWRGATSPYTSPPDAPVQQLLADLVVSADARLRTAAVALLLRHPEYAGDALDALDAANGLASRPRLLIETSILAAAALQSMWAFSLNLYMPGWIPIDGDKLAEWLGVPSPHEDYGRATLDALDGLLNYDSPFPTDHVGAWQDVGRHVLDDLREEALDYAAT